MPSQETLDRSTAIAIMRVSGTYFESEQDLDKFMQTFWLFERVQSGVDEAHAGPDVLLSRKILDIDSTSYSDVLACNKKTRITRNSQILSESLRY